MGLDVVTGCQGGVGEKSQALAAPTDLGLPERVRQRVTWHQRPPETPGSGQSLSLLICGMGVTRARKPAREPEEDPTCFFNTVQGLQHSGFFWPPLLPSAAGKGEGQGPSHQVMHTGQGWGLTVFQPTSLSTQ